MAVIHMEAPMMRRVWITHKTCAFSAVVLLDTARSLVPSTVENINFSRTNTVYRFSGRMEKRNNQQKLFTIKL